MKKLILVLLLSPFVGYSQSIDSLKSEILKLRTRQDHVNVLLEKGHSQFKSGRGYMIGGALFGVAGGLLVEGDLSFKKGWPWLLVFGGAVSATGIVIQINSHKWNRRALRFKP